MKFVRAIWKLLVGIKDALVLILMLLFFGGLYSRRCRRGRRRSSDGVLDLNLNGSVVEQPARAHWSDVASGNRLGEYRLRDLVAGARQGDGRRPGQGGRARPRRLYRRRTDRPSATLPTRSGACARRASR